MILDIISYTEINLASVSSVSSVSRISTVSGLSSISTTTGVLIPRFMSICFGGNHHVVLCWILARNLIETC